MECAAEYLGAAKAGRTRDGFERFRAVLEQHASALDPQRFDVGRGCLARLAAERAREGALAEVGAVGERGDGQIGVDVPRDPRLQLAQRRANRLPERPALG